MKLTKKSYNRRMFALGALIFLSIGLVSTGFAAFVMSKGATNNQDGHIQVGTITDGAVKFDEVNFKGDVNTIVFEAAKDDNDGEVKWDGTNYENLSVTLEGSVSPAKYVQGVTISITSTAPGIEAAADAGYIVLPDCYNQAQPVTLAENEGVKDFSYTITFAWGATFGNKNPSLFLDEYADIPDGNGGTRNYTYEEKKDLLIDFKRKIYNDTTSSDADILALATVLDFKVELIVTANV